MGSLPFPLILTGILIVAEAFGASSVPPLPPIMEKGAVSSYRVRGGGDLQLISGSVPTSQTTTCWIKYFDGYAITTNNFANSLSIVHVGPDGSIDIEDAVAASTSDNIFQPLDFDISSDGALCLRALFEPCGLGWTARYCGVSKQRRFAEKDYGYS